MTTPLSANFTVEELCRSQNAARLGIKNAPNATQQAALATLAQKVLEPLYKKFGANLIITSCFRSAALNAKTPGSSTTSQHTKGQAVDLEVYGMANLELAEWIVANLDFDQCILEFYNSRDPQAGWVHVSYVSPEKNRRAKLTAAREPSTGKTIYTLGFPKKRK